MRNSVLRDKDRATFVDNVVFRVQPPIIVFIVVDPMAGPSKRQDFFEEVIRAIRSEVHRAKSDHLIASGLRRLRYRVRRNVDVNRLLAARRTLSAWINDEERVFVGRHVNAPPAVVLFQRLLTRAVPRPNRHPKFAFKGVVVRATFRQRRAAPMNLYAQFRVRPLAPIRMDLYGALTRRFNFHVFRIVTCALSHVIRFKDRPSLQLVNRRVPRTTRLG